MKLGAQLLILCVFFPVKGSQKRVLEVVIRHFVYVQTFVLFKFQIFNSVHVNSKCKLFLFNIFFIFSFHLHSLFLSYIYYVSYFCLNKFFLVLKGCVGFLQEACKDVRSDDELFCTALCDNVYSGYRLQRTSSRNAENSL